MLNFPDFTLPTEGSLTKLVDGVYWLRMPLPFELNHINLYLIEDDDGWFIVDTGVAGKRTAKLWEQITQQLDKPICGVIVTHLHPDHIGQAGTLCEKWQVPLYMTGTEYYTARALRGGYQGASNTPDVEHYRSLGLDNSIIEKITQGGGGYSQIVDPIPVSFIRLHDGKTLSINKRNWQVMVGRGHSPEHACLYCEELNILLSGDHILPSISPNIGVYSTEPMANPLDDYLRTLVPFGELPAETLCCPAHGLPFTGIPHRANELISHHQEHLSELLSACKKPLTVLACLPVLFKRELVGNQLFFAVAECVSHLNYLLYQDKLERTSDENGVYHYKTAEREHKIN